MDYNKKLILGEKKNINEVNVDNLLKIKLENKQSPFIEYNIDKYISSSDVFETERENNNIYRLYGCIDYISLFNGLINSNTIEDFFIKKYEFESTKNLLNTFNFYLLMSHDNYDLINDDGEIKTHHKKFKVIGTDKNIILTNAGFSKNIFWEPKYYFQINLDIDLSNIVDGIGHPITELYLYIEYIPNTTNEKLYYRNKNMGLGVFDYYFNLHPINYINFNKWGIGDVLYDTGNQPIGSVIKENRREYSSIEFVEQTFIIETEIFHDGEDKKIKWEYNPFIPIKLKHLSSTISRANRNSTSYQQQMNIPYYALDLDNVGNVIWREILEDGVFDPITNIGVDHPFINGKKYVYNNIIITITPYLRDYNTKNIFNELFIDEYGSDSILPINDDIDNMLNTCV